MKQAFPSANIIQDTEVRNAHHAIEWLSNKGFTELTFVVGSDRVEEFTQRWLPYAEQMVNQARVVSAGHRDPDAEGVSGISASKARQAAVENNYAKFRAATGWSGNLAEQMFKSVRQQLTQD